ncbi:unnamed protein product [Schistocephalus solidus]|uniref:C2H2-type domain-containing protein n=1 Tax=Schistocephalus solidus TaxID=70667 RepID=A0A183T983_SCHSO|nr:unnamed protein product [Schistocephalus solidus]
MRRLDAGGRQNFSSLSRYATHDLPSTQHIRFSHKAGNASKLEAEALKKRFEAQTQRLTSTRRECHRRRLLLLAQQQLMDAGPQAYHRCPHCPKAFINASFLNAHLHRRHAEIVNALEPLTQGLVSSPRAQRQALGRNQLESKIREEASDLTPNLEHQLREVLDQLKSQKQPPQTETVVSEWQPVVVTPPRAASSPPPMWKERVDLLEQELQKEREWFREAEERNRIWQAAVADQHKSYTIVNFAVGAGLEIWRQRPPRILYNALEGPSNFGDLVDDPIDQFVRRATNSSSPVRHSRSSASDVIPVASGVVNANNAEQTMSWSSAQGLSPGHPPGGLRLRNEETELHYSSPSVTTVTSCTNTSPVRQIPVNPEPAAPTAATATKTMETAKEGYYKPRRKSTKRTTSEQKICQDVSVQAALEISKLHSTYGTSTITQDFRNRGIIVEGLIVRTEDEEEAELEAEGSRSIHVIPCGPLNLHPNASPKLSRAHDALADSLAELSTLAAVRHVQIVDDFSSIQESISTRPPRTSQSPPSRLVAPSTPESYQPISIESKMPTLRSRQSDELKPRVNFEHRPPAVSNVELRLEPTGNVIPYNLILNQLRSDPEALKRLRSEVEMLLSEQLVDHEIDPQASGISNEELKGRLDALKREREHLTRKHPNFAEIRASIAQQVDRMARIALHSKRDRDHHGKPVPTANQSKKPRMSASTPNSSTLAIAEEEAKNDVTQTSSPQPKQPSSSPHTSIVGTSQLRTDHPHRDSSTGTISMDRVVARRGVINGLNESMHTQSTFSLFEEVSEHPNGSRSERYLRTTSQPGIEEISLEGEEMGVDVGEPSAKRRFSTGHGDRHLSQDAPKVVKHEEAALPTSTAPCTITVLQSAAKSDSAQPALAKATTLESSEEWDSASDEENKAGPQTSFVSKRGAPSLEAKTRSKSPLEDLVVDDLTNLLDDLENTNETQIKKTDQTPKVRSSSLPGPSRPPFGRNNNFKRDEDDEVVSVSSLNPAEAGDTSVSLAFDTPPVGISTTSSGSMTPCRPPAYEAPVRPTTSIGRTPHTTLPRCCGAPGNNGQEGRT